VEGSGPSCAPRRHGDLGPGGRPLRGDSLARFPALGPSRWGLAWSGADTVLSEQGQRGTLENAQLMAAHESPRTTKLYDRTGDEITLDEVERISI
jgi:hypothetical protein